MYEVTYVKAASVAEAAALLAAHPEAKLLSGGMTLIPTLKQRLARPSHLVDIAQLAELKGISLQGDRLSIGAAVRHAEVAASDTVRRAIPALAALARQIGDPQVRNRGTLGGSVANNDPAADYPAAVLGLNADIVTSRATHRAEGFFQGVFATALEEGEIVARVVFPVPRRAAYAKFPHPASGYAMTGVFVADFGSSVRVAVTGAGPGVFRWPEAEAALARDFRASVLDPLAVSPDGLNADIHAPAEYRANLVKVMAMRAVESLQGSQR